MRPRARDANPDLAKQTVLALNIEHVAQRNFSAARTTAADGYRQAIADSGEAPAYAGISNRSPFIDGLIEQGVVRYGVNFVSQKSNMGSGESGGLNALPAPVFTVIQAPPLYHTTGEIQEVISDDRKHCTKPLRGRRSIGASSMTRASGFPRRSSSLI